MENGRQRRLLFHAVALRAGVTLWLCYGLAIGATALSFADAASIVFAGTCLVLKLGRGSATGYRRACPRARGVHRVGSYGNPGVIRGKAPLATEAFPVYFHEERRFLWRQRNH